ncbi:TPA: BRO family protein [Yersinia enterocolitica]
MRSSNGEAPTTWNSQGFDLSATLSESTDMKSIANNQLTFHSTKFNAVQDNGQVWLTSSELGAALQYSDDKAVQRIYSRRCDEFTEQMTRVVKVTTPRGQQETRVFSLRGAHLIAMFSRTTIAKEFRKWVLDILDREAEHSPITKQFSDDELLKMANMWLWADRARKMSKIIYPALLQMESTHSGNFYDLAYETRYVIEESRKVLVREVAHIQPKGRTAERGNSLLCKLRGVTGKEIH